jgi:hypothetical protein
VSKGKKNSPLFFPSPKPKKILKQNLKKLNIAYV